MSEGKLIIIPTPLGNLGDVTQRTLDAICACDVLCCEDTRVTGKLLTALGLSKRLERLDEVAVSKRAGQVVQRILSGEVIGFASDAGMPGVSDPGQRLVDAARNAGVAVEVLPGGTAVATAYVASGFPTQTFYFGAFFPRKGGDRKRILSSLSSLDAALVFYESPQRLVSALASIAEELPFRRVAVCRELTKLHEEVFRGTAPDVHAEFATRASMAPIKGEIVIVIDAPSGEEALAAHTLSHDDAEKRAAELLAEGTLTNKGISKQLRAEFGLSRNEAYDLVLSLSKTQG